MIPLRDSIPTVRTPVVRNALVAICAVVFLLQFVGGDDLTFRLGLVPARLSHADASGGLEVSGRWFGRSGRVHIDAALVPDWLTLVTCTFLHGGWLHILGNMWFLWIFGDNVEDRFGRAPFLLFYLGCGTAASLAHYLANPESPMPTIGASGAIAGVMGAYMLLYPHSRVLTLIPIGFFLMDAVLPAPLFLGFWFVLQLVQGTVDAGLGGGVAWWAHIGGFAVGAAVAALLRLADRLRPQPPSVELLRRRRGRPPWGGPAR
ncbi:MAG: rhomboid family intramembrane serine protease [Planctomycetes bacterium]|nr:rhomboid family intramembrane serine protease [Planctomycetota bacterium]